MERWLYIVTEDMMGCNHREGEGHNQESFRTVGNREQSVVMKDELYL